MAHLSKCKYSIREPLASSAVLYLQKRFARAGRGSGSVNGGHITDGTQHNLRSKTPWDHQKRTTFNSQAVKGSMVGGVPRAYYGWMRPGSSTRRRFEKMRNPFVDLDAGSSIYFRDTRDPVEAMRHEANANGLKGTNDSSLDLYNEYRVIPDLYPEGFQWKHKLNTEYNQWRSNTYLTPDVIPEEHRGRFLCNFQVNIGCYDMVVAKFGPFDARQWIYCCLYVGSGKGIAGWGQGVGPSSVEAKKEALKNAFENIIAVDMENEGPIYPIRLNVEGSRGILYPARKIVAGFRIADILCAFGFVHAGCRLFYETRNRPRSHPKMYGCVFEMIKTMKSATEIAHARGKVPHSLLSNAFPYMEEIRRRKGMMAMTLARKDGAHLGPDRVVDNRMPDHLKKGYYDDVYWKDFFAGSKGTLNEPRIGMRADEMRSLVPEIGGKEAMNVMRDINTGTSGQQRRTLASVLQRLKQPLSAVGPMQTVNPFEDKRLSTSAKEMFHLH